MRRSPVRSWCSRLILLAMVQSGSVRAAEVPAEGPPAGEIPAEAAPAAEIPAPEDPAAGTGKERRSSLEWAPLPAIGGNTDMGLMLGVQGVVAQNDPVVKPYRYRVWAQVAMSLKWWDGRGLYVPVHMHFLRADVPGLLDDRLRLFLSLEYNQRNNAGYYGLGNASRFRTAEDDPAAIPTVSRARQRYQYRQYEPLFRVNARYRIRESLFLSAGVRLHWERSEVYPGSALWEDRKAVQGLQDHMGLQGAVGLVWDSRDHEYVPSRGFYAEMQVRGSPGLGNRLHFGGVTLDGRNYVPLAGEWLVLASRVFTDLLFGNVPFYELSRASAYENREYPGGRDGFRGVPEGRLHGKVKLGVSAELRSMFWTFHLLGERFRVGALVLADVGRVWNGYRPDPERDGRGVGLHWGTGVGMRVQIAETIVARFDFGYSPDQAEQGFPLGIYVDVGHVF